MCEKSPVISHRGDGEICRLSDPPRAENPTSRILFSYPFTYDEDDKVSEVIPMPRQLQEMAAHTLKIPADVALSEPVITITGRRRVYLENYDRIVSLDPGEIRLQTRTCKIQILGACLGIEYYTRDEMLITGQIMSVNMEARGGKKGDP